ncbi:glycoside hydrolase family 24 protein [Chromobacterium subtsugae]|uniref:glycoside hydrolase family 24 protein n=1 Tax=Chromobacterium subtsugae TaxID=251747 RepID=UPI000AD6C3EC|nr:glycoside hydrolase family 104 protein [Chromobacterium subtsugae]
MSELVSEQTKTPLVKVAEKKTTPSTDKSTKKIKVDKKAVRKEQNEEYLKNPNVSAFLKAIAAAEGGGYDFKFGAVKGKKNDPWRFTDYSTHPGVGKDGKTTAAGMYQINTVTWKEMGGNMGLKDFSPHTQDLMAVEIFRAQKAIGDIVDGNIEAGLSKCSHRWAALPKGKGQTGRYNQPYMEYDDFEAAFKANGGTVK